VEYWANNGLICCSVNGAILGEKRYGRIAIGSAPLWQRTNLTTNLSGNYFWARAALTRNQRSIIIGCCASRAKSREDVSQTFLGKRVLIATSATTTRSKNGRKISTINSWAYFARVALKNGSLPGRGDHLSELCWWRSKTSKNTRWQMAPAVPYGQAKPESAEADSQGSVRSLADVTRKPVLCQVVLRNRVWSYFFWPRHH